mgnify:CR=1 FL=1
MHRSFKQRNRIFRPIAATWQAYHADAEQQQNLWNLTKFLEGLSLTLKLTFDEQQNPFNPSDRESC